MCKTSQKLKVCYVIVQNEFGLATIIDQLHNKYERLEQNTTYPNVCNTVIVLCSLSVSDGISHYIMETKKKNHVLNEEVKTQVIQFIF